ncbi:serine threonine kinase [Fusarium phyllophilum]|uniref:Serine threonine kinase n=1 Tax=Fusarium phyllophilum TaxID=47803 RepID=A0A8H5I5T5_9HYPO|nr:serine threonine kinase [Fusarium phyllophilum]
MNPQEQDIWLQPGLDEPTEDDVKRVLRFGKSMEWLYQSLSNIKLGRSVSDIPGMDNVPESVAATHVGETWKNEPAPQGHQASQLTTSRHLAKTSLRKDWNHAVDTPSSRQTIAFCHQTTCSEEPSSPASNVGVPSDVSHTMLRPWHAAGSMDPRPSTATSGWIKPKCVDDIYPQSARTRIYSDDMQNLNTTLKQTSGRHLSRRIADKAPIATVSITRRREATRDNCHWRGTYNTASGHARRIFTSQRPASQATSVTLPPFHLQSSIFHHQQRSVIEEMAADRKRIRGPGTEVREHTRETSLISAKILNRTSSVRSTQYEQRFPRNLIIKLSPLNRNVPADLTHQLDHPKLAHPCLTTKAHLGASVARKRAQTPINSAWRLKKCSGSEGDLIPGDEGQALCDFSFVGANVQIILGEIGFMERMCAQSLVSRLNAIKQSILSNIADSFITTSAAAATTTTHATSTLTSNSGSERLSHLDGSTKPSVDSTSVARQPTFNTHDERKREASNYSGICCLQPTAAAAAMSDWGVNIDIVAQEIRQEIQRLKQEIRALQSRHQTTLASVLCLAVTLVLSLALFALSLAPGESESGCGSVRDGNENDRNRTPTHQGQSGRNQLEE